MTLHKRIEQAKTAGYEVVRKHAGWWLLAPDGAWARGPFADYNQAWANGGIPPYKEPPPPEEKKPTPKRTRTRKKKTDSPVAKG